MSVSDPIADMLTRLRNAAMAGHEKVRMPSSRVRLDIAEVLKEEGFIAHYEVEEHRPYNELVIELRYDDKKRPFLKGLERVSKPGCRVYVAHDEIPRVYSGLGIAILSTSKGIMAGYRAWRRGLGGELLCYIW